MKKLLLVTAITVFGFTNVKAQDIEFGAKLAINFANIYGDTNDDIGPITSILNFGVMAEIPINEKFSFQPEVLYSTQGFSVDKDITALNYLNFPIMGKYYITRGLSVEAGPQIGFLLSVKNGDTNAKDNFKTVDFGANLGLGYKLKNGLNFGLRYNIGLSNINDIPGSTGTFRNGIGQVSIGYFF